MAPAVLILRADMPPHAGNAPDARSTKSKSLGIMTAIGATTGPRIGALQTAGDMEAAVHHENLAGDRARGRAEQEHRRVGNFAELDVTAQRRAVAIHLQDARESRNTRGGQCL